MSQGKIVMPTDLEVLLDFAQKRPPSGLSHHGDSCCERASAWFVAMARTSHLESEGPPAWIRQRWEWGPLSWPLHWCEAVKTCRMDCGALMALSVIAYRANGMTAWPVQLIQKYREGDSQNWSKLWSRSKCCTEWLKGPYAYHEAVAVREGNVYRIWDPTDNCWIDRESKGYGAIIALRINEGERIDINAPFKPLYQCPII